MFQDRKESRLVEMKDDDNWVKVSLLDLKRGNTFRMFEDPTRKMPVGEAEMIAGSDGYENHQGVPEIEVSL